jgi:aryl-alcohol dehydrogenase-like predicted oxidoreductase
MDYRPLGKTGLQVSALGFGASPLGGVFGDVDAMEADEVVHEAIESGINYFDVAPFYGYTRAETVLGKALRGIPRDRFFLATKIGRYGQTAFDFSAARAERSVEESLRRLGTDHLDVILCHDIEFGSLDQVVEETLPALRAMQAQGKVRFVGVSGLPLAIFPAVLERAELDVILSYCHYTLIDTTLAELVPYLQSKEVGIINASPLAMGLLTERPVPSWHPAPPEMKAACVRAAALCRERGVDIAQLAVSFALTASPAATTLIGMADREALRKNLAWMTLPPDANLLAEVSALLEPVHNQSWPSGRPENSRMPEIPGR